MTEVAADPWLAYEVIGRRDEAADVVTFTLSAPEAEARAGHHVIVSAPLDEPLRREYSLSAIRAGEIDITVKREGIVSTWLHDRVAVGDVLTASAPRGSFLLGEEDVPLVLLSCGIGITPMMAMAQEALAKGREVHFIHVARDHGHHAFRDLVDQWRREGALDAHLTYKYADGGAACDHVGEFTIEELRALLPSGEIEVKICGPSRFMQAMYEAALDLGVPRASIGWEAFGPSTVVPRATEDDAAGDASTENAPLVTFVDSQVAVRWDPESHSLLDFAEEHGVFPNFSCRQGSCESCLTRVKNGEFEYVEEPFETPEPGEVLLCCSRPVTDIELVV